MFSWCEFKILFSDGIDSSDVVILGSFSLGESFQSQLNKLSTSILEQLLLRLQNYDNVGDEASKQKLAAVRWLDF